MAEILGKFTASSSYEIPRGADVCLRVELPAAWLAAGSMIEVELPRNLTCARCSGGGCSVCNNSGAITLRGKEELPEFVQVALPMQRALGAKEPTAAAADHAPVESAEDVPPMSARPIMIRIPECGGLPDAANCAIVRGWLLLEVAVADSPSSNVRLLDADEDPSSSSKLLRAEVRQSGREPSVAGDSAKLVTASRSIRPARHASTSDQPPSSRVARAGSTLPPDVKRKGDVPSEPASPAGPDAIAPAQTRHRLSWGYLGIVIIVAAGVLALLLL